MPAGLTGVIPAQAGIQCLETLDPGLRRRDARMFLDRTGDEP